MATLDLWQRVWGDVGGDPEDPQDGKIAIHTFWGAIFEWQQGYETQQNIIAMFDIALGSDQSDQAIEIKQRVNAAPDITRFIRVCKDWAYIAEYSGIEPKYRDWAQFVLRMDGEITDQGGTPP
jgi:hypothetical protein